MVMRLVKFTGVLPTSKVAKQTVCSRITTTKFGSHLFSQQLDWLPSILKSCARSTNVMRDGSRPFLGAKTFSFN